MAKSSGPPEKRSKYPYPSRFGSHASMLNTVYHSDINQTFNGLVTLTDEHGDYTTEVSRLDNGMADPNRYATSRLKKLFANDKRE